VETGVSVARVTKIADPRKRAKAAHDLIEELQATVADLSRLRREAFEQMLDSGMSQTDIAVLLDISRSRVSQLMSGVAKPERRFLGTGALTIAVAASETGKSSDEVAPESLAAYQALAQAAGAVGLDTTYEVIARPGNVHLNRPNLIVLGGPKLLPFVSQIMEADPYLRFEHDKTGWHLVDRHTGKQYRSLRDRHVSADYGYIGRLPKPDGSGTFLYLAGIHAQGTLGAATYVAENLVTMHRQMKSRRFSAIVSCAYDPDSTTQPSIVNARLETPCYRHDAT
jgi:predicted XRE-type DNA-binding protein